MAVVARADTAASHRTSSVMRRTRFPHLRVGNRVHFLKRLREALTVWAQKEVFASGFTGPHNFAPLGERVGSHSAVPSAAPNEASSSAATMDRAGSFVVRRYANSHG